MTERNIQAQAAICSSALPRLLHLLVWETFLSLLSFKKKKKKEHKKKENPFREEDNQRERLRTGSPITQITLLTE